MRAQIITAIAIVLAFASAPATIAAEDGGWKLPNLNPFSQKGKPPTSARASTAKSSGWQWPKLWTGATTAKAKTRQPSAAQKVTNSTKQFFSKTADALNPWDDAKDQQASAPKPPTGKNVFSQASASKSKNEKSTSLIPSWPWGDKEKPQEERPKTVTDFLAQPRIQP
jgi:hypothetical protein